MEHRNTVNLRKKDKKKEKETCFLCEKEGDNQCFINHQKIGQTSNLSNGSKSYQSDS